MHNFGAVFGAHKGEKKHTEYYEKRLKDALMKGDQIIILTYGSMTKTKSSM